MAEYLFVYGTLRSGFENPHAEKLREEAELVGAATVTGSIYHLGSYPGFSFQPPGNVTGELYRLLSPDRTLHALDAYEGSEYTRERVLTSTGHSAWIYAYRGPFNPGSRIASGDFLNP